MTDPRHEGPKLLIQATAHNQRVLRRAHDAFHGLHVGADAGSSTVGYVRSSGRPTIIDPKTSLFRVRPKQLLDPKTKMLKPPVLRLAARYGGPFEQVAGKRKLECEDLLGDAGVRAVVAVLDHQRRHFGPQLLMAFDSSSKYRLWGTSEEAAPPREDPRTLVPPFFYVRSAMDPWFDTNLAMARHALAERRAHERVTPVVHFAPAMLEDAAAVDALVAVWAREPVDGYLIWPDGQKEEDIGDRADGLVRLVEGLAATGRPVTKLFGGFLSVLLWRRGLAGFSCGLNGTTYRRAFAFGGRPPGGKPPKKYYIPGLFRSFPLDEARLILQGNPSLRCECVVCEARVGPDFSGIEELVDPGLAESHFLNCRRDEIDRVVQSSPTELRRWLERSANVGEWAEIADSDFPRQWARCVA